ncbi:putative peptidoglycan binding protein [Krasilnikovia cinnamomea]|uniref:Putative peptidoglycan binding protein n=1 Tax=Krasilnikovia cinnamomea TaxID=349313 RepID=A0A4Q7ZUV0_9ACTN|nr:peptidoglycan-binding domain-containing protein [Krasilnikovia cinnamomea]RZU54369.1 putative peptidoglycan binding protein [Krasilnikovia cinnamomea]
MAGEPELHPHTSSEWVTYLQQLLNHYGVWSGPEDGDYGDELLAAVRGLQQQYQLTPADGVVRADLWALLAGESSSAPTDGGHPDGGHPDGGHPDGGHPDGGPHGDSHTLHGTGAHAEEFPASMMAGGLPAFKYNLPSVPIAEVSFDTGNAAVDMRLSLIGSVTVTFEHAAQGVTTTVNDQTWRLAAQQSLDGITEGIQIQGVGGDRVSFSTTFGNQFEQTEVRFTPPNTMSFLGSCLIGYHVDTEVGQATVRGSVGFQLDVTVTPHPTSEPAPEVQDERGWFEEYAPVILTGTVIALVVVVAIAAAPETGGGSLELIPLAAGAL